MKKWCYKWLPIICCCHCRDDRSFHFRGERFPVCARCTGLLLGIPSALVGFLFFRISAAAAAIIMIPMIVDGFVQLLTRYESTNLRRCVTGFLFGYGLASLFLLSGVVAYQIGYNLTH